MSRCVNCGKYVDPFEYPSDQMENYRPDLCFSCLQEKLENDIEQEEGETTTSEQSDDGDADDSPIFTEEEQSTEEDRADESIEPDERADETRSIQNLRKMLFG